MRAAAAAVCDGHEQGAVPGGLCGAARQRRPAGLPHRPRLRHHAPPTGATLVLSFFFLRVLLMAVRSGPASGLFCQQRLPRSGSRLTKALGCHLFEIIVGTGAPLAVRQGRQRRRLAYTRRDVKCSQYQLACRGRKESLFTRTLAPHAYIKVRRSQ